MPGCCVAVATEKEWFQESQDGWAITLHVHHTADQDGAKSLWASRSSCRLNQVELMRLFDYMQGSMTEQYSCAASADSPTNAEEVVAKCSWFQVTPSSTFASLLWSYHVSA